jgi:hypothetical protein
MSLLTRFVRRIDERRAGWALVLAGVVYLIVFNTALRDVDVWYFGFILLVPVLWVAFLLISPARLAQQAGRMLFEAVRRLRAFSVEQWVALLYVLSMGYLLPAFLFRNFFDNHFRPVFWTALAVNLCVNLGIAGMHVVATAQDALRWLRDDAPYFLPRLLKATRAAKAAWDEKWEERIEAEEGFNVVR